MIEDWEERAMQADGGAYAVALAILGLARSIDKLGNADASTPMGAIEGLAAHLGEKIDGMADSLDSIADSLNWGEALGLIEKTLDSIADSLNYIHGELEDKGTK